MVFDSWQYVNSSIAPVGASDILPTSAGYRALCSFGIEPSFALEAIDGTAASMRFVARPDVKAPFHKNLRLVDIRTQN